MLIPILLIGLVIGGAFAYKGWKGSSQNVFGCNPSEVKLLNDTLELLAQNKTAPKEQILSAYKIAERCFPETASKLHSALEKLAESKLSGQALTPPAKGLTLTGGTDKAKSLLMTPDLPALPIPVKEVSGPHGSKIKRPLWNIVGKGISAVAVPGLPDAVLEFQSFQKIVGVKPDGKIGKNTLGAFVKMAKERGFAKYPTDVPSLAANVTKWGIILHSGVRVAG